MKKRKRLQINYYIIDKSSCLASQILGLNCIWMADQCNTNSCKAILTKENCFQSIRNSQKCFFTQNRDEDNYCVSCSQLTEQCKCNQYSIFGCQWQNNSCQELQLQLSCNTYQNEKQCVDDQLCVWYKPMNKCLTIEEAKDNDRACDIYVYGSILHIWTLFILIVFW